MPELPEVENVKLSLERLGTIGQAFSDVELRRAGLRVPFPEDFKARLAGQHLLGIRRRAKFLLLETEDFVVLSHLGMTGSWRALDELPLRKHDHAIFHFASGLKLVFNDPRRFGVLDLMRKDQQGSNRWLKHLGVEPLSDAFSADYLFSRTRGRALSIKGFLMDQKNVVGVGNIYASEALYGSGVKPMRRAGRITRTEAGKMVSSIQHILRAAIRAGGSTIKDYKNSEGKSGNFQSQFLVYDRGQLPCLKCGAKVRVKTIAGRTTFWCAQCQR